MSDGKIYIIVTDKLPGAQPGPGPAPIPIPSPTESDSNQESLLGKYAYHRFFNFLESQAKQAVNYTLNNIGNFTGDYQTQRDVQAGLSAINKLYNIGNAAMTGFMMSGGNPAGAVIGASIATLSIGINFAYELNSIRIQERKTNFSIEKLRERSGLNTINDGSRGTEN